MRDREVGCGALVLVAGCGHTRRSGLTAEVSSEARIFRGTSHARRTLSRLKTDPSCAGSSLRVETEVRRGNGVLVPEGRLLRPGTADDPVGANAKAIGWARALGNVFQRRIGRGGGSGETTLSSSLQGCHEWGGKSHADCVDWSTYDSGSLCPVILSREGSRPGHA